MGELFRWFIASFEAFQLTNGVSCVKTEESFFYLVKDIVKLKQTKTI